MLKSVYGITALVLAAALLIKCGGNSVDPNAQVPMPPIVDPAKPVDPTKPVIPKPEHYRGFKRPEHGGLHAGAPFMLADVKGNLPLKFNWIENGYNEPVKNQGSCGSCWAFSTVENMEFALQIFLGKKLILAPQALVGTEFYGCGGGDFAGQHEVDKGLPLEKDCPYQADNSDCGDAKIAAKAVSFMNIGDGQSSPTVTQLQEALREYGPLSISVAATASWDNYKGGVKQNCGGTAIDHMILLLGWDGQGNWIVRNQWGESWGDKGTGLLPYGCDAVASDAATVLVK